MPTLICRSDGEFEIEDPRYAIGGTVPTCRASAACPNSGMPSPPGGAETSPHFLQASSESNVKEFDSAKFKCQDGAR